ncbi:MAG: phenylalanine--tRNA ligase subunit beta, partial [Acidimicrobiia bacterium]
VLGDLEVGRRKIRGITSNGMICSARELELGEDHAGIMVLEPGLRLGSDFAEYLPFPDVVFDLSITPNRPDAMSVQGLARELGAYFRLPVRMPATAVEEAAEVTAVRVEIADPGGCYRFVAREVAGVSVGPSPLSMQIRLRAAGIRPINNVVDVSNYVMVELGQPIHMFDLDRLAEERIVVRRAGPGERLRTLDGVDRELTPDDLVVADARRPEGLAGTMGGDASEVSSSTTRVLIEAAAWDPPTIMFMSRRHGLRSEASARFERGVDPSLPPVAAARAARLLLEVAGGRALAGAQDEVAVPKEPWTVELPLRTVARTLGERFDAPLVAELLGRLHLRVEGDDPLRVTVPTFRPDLTRPADLVEEVGRLYGIDRFPETLPTGKGGGWSTDQRRLRLLRSLLTGVGLSEAVSLSFLDPDDLDRLGLPVDDPRRRVVRVKNPLRDEESLLRTTLLPGLLRSAHHNISHDQEDVALFEVGKVVLDQKDDTDPRIPAQPDRLGFVLVGRFGSSDLGLVARPVDVFSATALWRLLVHRLDLGAYRLQPMALPGLHPGRAARVLLGGAQEGWSGRAGAADLPVGWLGELHPAAARAFELPGRVTVGELELAPLVAAPPLWQFSEPSPFPPVSFDLSFEVEDSLPASDLVAATASAAGGLLEDVEVFDEFAGESLPAGRKALAIRYTLRAPDRTLTNEEAAPVRLAIIEAARDGLDAILRGT